MFDLDARIRAWRHATSRVIRGRTDAIEELESHLRDELDRLTQAGHAPEQAWTMAVARLGSSAQLAGEFDKLPPMRGPLGWWPARVVLGVYAVLGIALVVLLSTQLAAGKVTLLLATHVSLVTLGYAAVFAAGAMAMWSVVARALGQWTSAETDSLWRTMQPLFAVALVTTFAGVFLGGVWARGAFGHFWSWDAREVGGAIVLVWSALAWRLLARPDVHELVNTSLGLAGNVVVSFCWFGPGLIGHGLHAYGHNASPILFGCVLLQGALFALLLVGPRHVNTH